MPLYVLLSILIFGFLIIIHESGHFFAAKLSGIRVNEFSIGAGPLLWQHQSGETQFSLRLLPLIAYCALESEEGDHSPRSFAAAPPWKRFLVLSAGSAANLLTGLLVVVLMYAGVRSFATTTIVGFAPGFPSQGETMLMEGDRIRSINGKAVLLNSEISLLLGMDSDEKADIEVERDGKRVRLEAVPLALREYEENGQRAVRYGISFGVEQVGPLGRLRCGALYTLDFARMTFWGLEMLFRGQAGIQDLRGPVGMVSTMSDVGRASPTVLDAVLNLLYLGAFLAVNLGVMNLMPLPGLDGGQILLLVLNELSQRLFGVRMPQRVQQSFNGIGLLLLLALVVFVAFQDIARLVTGG